MYSVIQTIGLEIIFAEDNEYTDFLYIYMDFVIALNLANCIGLLGPRKKLQSSLPHFTLLNLKFMISLGINFLITFAFMFFGIWMVTLDKGYFPTSSRYSEGEGLTEKRATFESTIISLLAMQGTFHIAVSFNVAGEFKVRFYRQKYFMISLVIYSLFQLYLIFNGRNWIEPVDNFFMDNLNFVVFDEVMKIYVLLLLLAFSMLSVFVELVLIKLRVPSTKKLSRKTAEPLLLEAHA